jgi:hypothetical protein
MQSRRELIVSAVVVAIIGGVYTAYEVWGTPGGGEPLGQIMGVAGLVMMLMTETLYSLRKRVRRFRAGRLRAWLSFHIFTGIVGPALVLAHSAFEFNGLAGISLALTFVVVGSGFIGRYLYTSIPRTRAGAELSLTQITAQITTLQADIDRFTADRRVPVPALSTDDARYSGGLQATAAGAMLQHTLAAWRYRLALNRQLRQVDRRERQQLSELTRMLRRRRELERQVATLRSAHQLLSVWHSIHVPLTLTLFLSIFLHVGGVLYYGAVQAGWR